MKLELKHLAPYLPYDLKIECHSEEEIQLKGSYVSVMKLLHADGIDDNYGNNWNLDIKPILRPLSDLTKEIEVNGEKFLPIIELAKLFHTNKSALTHFTNIVDAGFYGISVNCHIENDDSRFTYYQLRNSEFVLSNTYEEIQKLFEWHFDVFGLIKQNLAIDVNTL